MQVNKHGCFNGLVELNYRTFGPMYFYVQRIWTTVLDQPDYTKPYLTSYCIGMFDFEVHFKFPATIANFLRRIFFPRPGEKRDWKSLTKQHTKKELFK